MRLAAGACLGIELGDLSPFLHRRWHPYRQRPRRHVTEDHGVGADRCSLAHDDRTEDARTRADNHVVADAWIAARARRADSVAAEEDDAVSDLRVAADDDAHRMHEGDTLAQLGVARDLDAEERRLQPPNGVAHQWDM